MNEITLKIQIPADLEGFIKTIASIQSGVSPEPTDEDPDEIWDGDDLCAYFKIPKSKLYDLTMKTDRTAIPRFKVGRALRFKKSEAMAWFDQQRAV